MKHNQLRAAVHNVADSFASGIGLLIGHYEMDVYGEARASKCGFLTVDFLKGEVVEGEVSQYLAEAVALYRDALKKLISEAGGSIEALNKPKFVSGPISFPTVLLSRSRIVQGDAQLPTIWGRLGRG